MGWGTDAGTQATLAIRVDNFPPNMIWRGRTEKEAAFSVLPV